MINMWKVLELGVSNPCTYVAFILHEPHMNVVESASSMTRRERRRTESATLKLEMVLNHLRPHWIKCNNNPDDREWLFTTKLTGRSAIRTSDPFRMTNT